MARLALREGLHTQVCFHAQQAAEKALKSLMTYGNFDPPKTHSLPQLLALLENVEPPFSRFADELETLDIYYMPTRYPDTLPGSLPEGLPGKEEAEEALVTARKVSEAVRGVIKRG